MQVCDSWLGKALKELSSSYMLGVLSEDPGVNDDLEERRGEEVSSRSVDMKGISFSAVAVAVVMAYDDEYLL